MTKLAIFDLDNTLLAGDSDYLWGQFLSARGLVDAASHSAMNQQFYADYQAGVLDIQAFIEFSFAVLARHDLADLQRWRADYVAEFITPIVAPQARALLDRHRARGDELLIITATNSFITAPIAELLDVPHLLGTDPECRDGRFTGRLSGIPCFQEGKIRRLESWLAEQGREFEQTWFYSDSINDAPLLQFVDHPHAVDPCPQLRELAVRKDWPILSLRA